MKSLIKVDGINEQFCSIVFVHNLYTNGVLRESFPRDFKWLIKRLQTIMRSPDSRHAKGLRTTKYFSLRNVIKKLNILTLNANNLHHAVKEVYSYPRDFYKAMLNYERHYPSRFTLMMEALPKRFVEVEELDIDCTYFQNVDSIKIGIIKVREEAISYLSQKYERKFESEVELLKRLSQSTDSIDFDKYIDDWARRLVEEVKMDRGYGERR